MYFLYFHLINGPTVGALNAESPKRIFQKCSISDLVTKYVFFLRISTIFCMRETVIISNGSRILPCPLGLQNDLKTMIYFLTFFQTIFFILFESPYFCFFFGATVGPFFNDLDCQQNAIPLFDMYPQRPPQWPSPRGDCCPPRRSEAAQRRAVAKVPRNVKACTRVFTKIFSTDEKPYIYIYIS